MKILLVTLVLLFLLFSIVSSLYAEIYYVINKEGEVIVKCYYEPDKDDLASRDEIAVKSNEDIPLEEVEYKNGKIQRKTKIQEEIISDEQEAIVIIQRQILQLTIEKEKAEELGFIELARQLQLQIDKFKEELKRAEEDLSKVAE